MASIYPLKSAAAIVANAANQARVAPLNGTNSTGANSASGSSSKGTSGSSSGSSSSASSSQPYMDAWNEVAKGINNSYDAQVALAAQNKAAYEAEQNSLKDAYLQGMAKEREAWLKNQEETRANYIKRSNESQERDKTATNAGYDDSAKQNYINYMQAQKNLPDQLNALGIRGGATESSLIRLGSNYGTNVANNERARNDAIAALTQQYAKALADYEAAYKQGLFDYDQSYNSNINAAEQDFRQRLADYGATYNNTLASLLANRDESLTSGLATAKQNQITYDEQQKEIARQIDERNKELQRELERDAYNQRWQEQQYKDSRADKELDDFRQDTQNLSVSRLNRLIEQYSNKNLKDPNRVTKLNWLYGLLALRGQEGASASGGGGGYSSGGYSSGGYSSGGGSDNTSYVSPDDASNFASALVNNTLGAASSVGSTISSKSTPAKNNSSNSTWRRYGTNWRDSM